MGIKVVTYNLEKIYVALSKDQAARADERFLVFDELRRFLHHHIEKKFKDMFEYKELIEIVDSIARLYDICSISAATLTTGKIFYTLEPRFNEYRIAIQRKVEASILIDGCPFGKVEF